MALTPMQSLFLSQKFSDVSFIVENRLIYAHKNLLAASCPYFETMLFGATNESKMATIDLKNVSYEMFVEILRGIYYQKVDIKEWSAEEVKTLIQIADEYQLPLLGQIAAETLSESQITVDTVDDVYGAGRRLNCGQLIQKCEEFAQRNLAILLSNEVAFDKLSMALIGHLMDKNVFYPRDEKLLYSISNWRYFGSIAEKKTLLSKLDWKHLPREYSEPLLQTLLQSGDSGINIKTWCKSVKEPASHLNKVASVYKSWDNKFLDASDLQSFLTEGCEVSNYNRRESAESHLMIQFCDYICDVVRITFKFDASTEIHGNYIAADTSILLTVLGKSGVLEVNKESRGSVSPTSYEFALSKEENISAMRISFGNNNCGYDDYDYDESSCCYYYCGKIHNFEFHHI